MPHTSGSSAPTSPGRDPFADAVEGHHLRAARALLGWAMQDLAGRSGLSLSTVRRMEENTESVLERNRRSALDALEQGGIRFLILPDGTLALARQKDDAVQG